MEAGGHRQSAKMLTSFLRIKFVEHTTHAPDLHANGCIDPGVEICWSFQPFGGDDVLIDLEREIRRLRSTSSMNFAARLS